MSIRPTILPTLLSLSLVACAGEDDPTEPPGCDESLFADADGDGYGDPASAVSACEAPEGYIALADDCDDGNASVHPEAQEICDGSDNNCNALVDSADPDIDLSTERAYFVDADGDGHGDSGTSMTSCDRPSGYALVGDDCNDEESAVHPEASETCDGLDNDCDNLYDDDDDSLDASTAGTYYADGDSDGYGSGAAVVACNQPIAYADQAGDCDDADGSAHPGADEICDAVDNDCDGGNDGTPAAQNQCAGMEGTLTGDYSHYTAEKLGATVINEVDCGSGSSTITVDLDDEPAVQGSLSCSYPGSLGGFSGSQAATVEAVLALDGTVTGTLTHTYGFQMQRTYSFTGVLDDGELSIVGMGSWLPNPMSAVPWETDFSVAASD